MKNKSIVVLILSSLVVFAGCGNDMSNTGGEGSGQTSCNISIANYKAFDKIRENLSCNYTLTANIDFEMRTDFEPIGTENKPFTGVLDGAGHTIKNVTIDKSKVNDVGVIGFAEGASIKNLTFEDVSITSKENHRTGVIGTNNGTISNVYVKSGTIKGHEGNSYYVGGLVGSNSGTIENSYSAATVTGNTNVGGLVGQNFGIIENSYATGKVNGPNYVGGLVGTNGGINAGTIENSYATGKVNGTTSTAGGLAGSNSSNSSIKNSYATGEVTGTNPSAPGHDNTSVGGLVESNSGTIENSYYDKDGTKQTDTEDKGIGVSKGTNIVKRDNKYYDTLETPSDDNDDVEIFKGWDFVSVWVFTERQWPKLAWQTN